MKYFIASLILLGFYAAGQVMQLNVQAAPKPQVPTSFTIPAHHDVTSYTLQPTTLDNQVQPTVDTTDLQ